MRYLVTLCNQTNVCSTDVQIQTLGCSYQFPEEIQKEAVMRTFLFITTVIATFASMSATANSYITVEGTSVTVQDNLDGELNPMGLRFRLGAPIGENLDIEGHFGFAGDSRESAYDEFGTSYAGVYVKGYVPIGFNSAFYALGGYSMVALSQTINGSEFSDERHGFSYGAGLETQISERIDLTADYMRYVRDEGLFEDISAVSFGLKFYF